MYAAYLLQVTRKKLADLHEKMKQQKKQKKSSTAVEELIAQVKEVRHPRSQLVNPHIYVRDGNKHLRSSCMDGRMATSPYIESYVAHAFSP